MACIMNDGLQSDQMEDHGHDVKGLFKTNDDDDDEMEDSMDLDVDLGGTTATTATIHAVKAPQRPVPRLVSSILRTGSYDEATRSTATATATGMAGSYHRQQEVVGKTRNGNPMVSFQHGTAVAAATTAAASLHASFDASQLDGYHSKRQPHLETSHQSLQQQTQSPFRELFPPRSPHHRPVYSSSSWEESQQYNPEFASSPAPPATTRKSSHAPLSASRRNSPGLADHATHHHHSQHHHHHHHASKTPVRSVRLRVIKKTSGKRTPVSAKRKHRCSNTSPAASSSKTSSSTANALHKRQSPNLKRSLSSSRNVPRDQQVQATATMNVPGSWPAFHSDMPPPLPAAPAASSSTLDTSVNSSSTPFSVLWKEDEVTTGKNINESGMTSETPFFIKKPAKLSLGTVTTAASSAARQLLETTDDSIESTANTSDGGGTAPFRFTSFPASLPRIHTLRTTTATTAAASTTAKSAVPSCPGTVRKRMSFGEPLPVYPQQHYQAQQQQQQQYQYQHQYNFNSSNMMLHRSHDTSLSSVPDEDVQYGYSDDDDDDIHDDDELVSNASHMGTPVARTRLNFSSAISPQVGAVASTSVCSSAAASTNTPAKPSGSMTPMRNILDAETCGTPQDHVLQQQQMQQDTQAQPEAPPQARPGTPTEVKMHFHSGVQCCSPIRGIPEEDGDGDLCSSKASSTTVVATAAAAGRKSDTALSTSRESSSSSTSTSEASSFNSSKKRMRQRPMPDMNAFDGDAMTTSASSLLSRDRSAAGDDTTSTSNASQPPPSPKLLCPPTPVRTPAWAHCEASLPVGHHSIFKKPGGKFGRQNSLIATKVLATCSPQVLDGRTSLENSILEEEQPSHSSNGSARHEQQQQSRHHGTMSSSMKAIARAKMDDTPANHEQDAGNVAMADGDNEGHGQGGGDDWFHSTAPTDAQDHPLKRGARRSLGGGIDSVEPHGPVVGPVVSMSASFDILNLLGSGTFADVYKVRSKTDGKLYAVKKNRRHFRGRRDREKALAEVRYMQRLQSVCASNKLDSQQVDAKSKMSTTSYSLYLLFFYQAWQEEGHFFCQTELCCRDTCRELMDALRSDWCRAQARYPCLGRLAQPSSASSAAGPTGAQQGQQDTLGRLMPESTIWKICHDISAGLSHIHSHGLVHNDIKPSNMFFVSHSRFGAMCKIGDFGMAGDIGTSEDGQEGDQKYMAPELLSFSGVRHPSADIFSLGLTLYEMASTLSFEVPSEGPRWHEVRGGGAQLFDHHHIPPSRDAALIALVRSMLSPDRDQRPAVDSILQQPKVEQAGTECEEFLREYIHDLEAFDRREEQDQASLQAYSHANANNTTNTSIHVGDKEEQTPTVPSRQLRICLSPMTSAMPPVAPMLYSPEAASS